VSARQLVDQEEVGVFELEQLTGYFGAEVTGVDLAHDLSPEVFAKLSDALGEHKVLVFRDQHDVGPAEQVRLARYFGDDMAVHPVLPRLEGWPDVTVLASQGDEVRDGRNWHTDGATRDVVAYVSIVRSPVIPPQGRDTLFADMEAAFERFSPPLRTFLEGLQAEHSWGSQFPEAPPVEHPLVIANRRTGRKAIYANRVYTRRIVGLREEESEVLLDFLCRQALVADFQLRVRWRPGTVMMWDNASTQHHGTIDFIAPRVLHRVMVRDDMKAVA
jgi:taurine dioxygenase